MEQNLPYGNHQPIRISKDHLHANKYLLNFVYLNEHFSNSIVIELNGFEAKSALDLLFERQLNHAVSHTFSLGSTGNRRMAPFQGSGIQWSALMLWGIIYITAIQRTPGVPHPRTLHAICFP